jgi:hypothetical protein
MAHCQAFCVNLKGIFMFGFLSFYLIAIDFASVCGNILNSALAGSPTQFETG